MNLWNPGTGRQHNLLGCDVASGRLHSGDSAPRCFKVEDFGKGKDLPSLLNQVLSHPSDEPARDHMGILRIGDPSQDVNANAGLHLADLVTIQKSAIHAKGLYEFNLLRSFPNPGRSLIEPEIACFLVAKRQSLAARPSPRIAACSPG